MRRSLLSCSAAVALVGGAAVAILGDCGPFTDVTAAFCPAVFDVFVLGVTAGTTPTTYGPNDNVTRLQMALFLKRAVDTTLVRGSRRAALDQFWTTQGPRNLGRTTVGVAPGSVKSDGADLWVANFTGGSVSRVRASDGRLLETWTGATGAIAVLVAMGRIFVTGGTTPGSRLYEIDPSQPAGTVTTITNSVGQFPQGIAFDGSRIWTANSQGSVSIVAQSLIGWIVTTVATGFTVPLGILYDGGNIWVTDNSAGTLLKLDSSGAILKTVAVGSAPHHPIFDGTNIWVPNFGSNSVSVVRASSGQIVATLTGNGLNAPIATAFDGQRVLVTNSAGDSVSLWKAADLTAIGSFETGTDSSPAGACSDGLNFWITLNGLGQLARF